MGISDRQPTIQEKNVLGHVELGSALLVTAELHDKILVAGLTLSNGSTEPKLGVAKVSQDREESNPTHDEQDVLIVFRKKEQS